MLNIVFYFQVHQPYRLTHFNVLDIGQSKPIFDDKLNGDVMRKVAQKCYLPTNKLLLDLIKEHEGRFKIAFSITGTAIEQFKLYSPETLDSFKALADTGYVEFIGETYYHSLAFLYDSNEFLDQVMMHRDLMKKEFSYDTETFRNTELIYQDRLSDLVFEIPGFKTILTEGVDRVLQWRSPLYAYKNYSKRINLLLKYYQLADDIAFRFSNRDWPEYPLTVEKFVSWIDKLTLNEYKGKNQFLNLFMDYETFGEHQWASTGIFDFMRHFPAAVLQHQHLGFAHPKETTELSNYQQESVSFPEAVSWADEERDLSAWLENDMQHNAIETLYALLDQIKVKGDPDLLRTARMLSTSDHFYYMCAKYFQDGDVHKYFSPYDSPDQAYIYYINALAELEERLLR
ncbi:MAG: glycoside hydrolase family 57 protein [Candidatus Cloacimonetes bacterium]|jgi:alpha-amylase|nr:glycoside hydrolase family 57 protein [Candidatus Cloacimonadota bacterium]MDY0298464.1 glycoside hydrolase family 57 protein [Candidatus Cloacimonadaceae bacterium]MCK9332263.1 glycoside hydrolase family 57 protein [Candidatus Cloacimonadota bacterium]MDD2210127.1 glycoside hydrolase family 57 protein [Candidatus Cloacimonadota bacterium]MDD3281879.1 glycoside hydrolase family 57 protein [Candidatus Cloacimonadota bacterium]